MMTRTLWETAATAFFLRKSLTLSVSNATTNSWSSVSIFWFTGSGASSANAMYEGMQAFRAMVAQQSQGASAKQSEQTGPPTGVVVFATDNTIRSLFDPGNRISHWSEFDRGGHSPAMEVPNLLVGGIRAFFSKLR